MSNIKSENFLINLNWKREIFENIKGIEDYELAGMRLVYLFLSMENIMRNSGDQVLANNVEIDYPVRSLINQLKTMRGDTDSIDTEIALLREQGKSSQQIAEHFNFKGVKITDSGVRKKNGWKNYHQYLSPEGEITKQIWDF